MLITGDYRGLLLSELGLELSDKAQFLGESVDGEIISMAAFDNYDTVDIDIHIVAKRISRKWVRACMAYVFDVCKCRRMTSLNDSNNFQMKPYLERLGFQYEGTKRHGLADSDLIIYGLLKEDIPSWASPK